MVCQNLPDDFEVLHMANTGRVYTLIVKGDPKEAEKVLSDRKSYHCGCTSVDTGGNLYL